MRMVVRFQSETKDILTEDSFFVEGQTPGWTGRLEDSPFVHRKERMSVPAYARRLRFVISSAGPPEAVGVYAVRNLVVSQPGITSNIIPLIPRMTNDLTDLPLLASRLPLDGFAVVWNRAMRGCFRMIRTGALPS